MNNKIQFLLYNMPDNSGEVKVLINGETLWCTQKAMSQLFDVGVPAISKHISNIYEEGKLVKYRTISKMETVVNRGFRGEVSEFVDFYNLDAVFRELQGIDFRFAPSSPRFAWVPSIYAVMADTVFPCNSLQTTLQLQFFLTHTSSSTISNVHHLQLFQTYNLIITTF